MRRFKFQAYLKSENKVMPVNDISFFEFDDEPIGLASCGRLDCGTCVEYYNADEIELLRFTGLTDKNGVDIYEGDIVSKENSFGIWKGKVGFDEGSFKIGSSLFEKFDTIEDMGSTSKLKNEYEVIGNIYENPELL